MGASISTDVFSVIDNEVLILSSLMSKRKCDDDLCHQISSEKIEQMCDSFSENQLQSVCQKVGIQTTTTDVSTKRDMSAKIVSFYMKKTKLLSQLKSCNSVQELEATISELFVEVHCAKCGSDLICPKCDNVCCKQQIDIQVNPTKEIVYKPVEVKEVKPGLHTFQGTKKVVPDTVRITADEIKRYNDNVFVRNPKSIEVTRTVPKSKLPDYAKSLGPNTQIVKIEKQPSIQNIPRGTSVQALADHVPKTLSELPLVKGQRTSYLEPGPRDWALVKHADGNTGYVPGSHLSL